MPKTITLIPDHYDELGWSYDFQSGQFVPLPIGAAAGREVTLASRTNPTFDTTAFASSYDLFETSIYGNIVLRREGTTTFRDGYYYSRFFEQVDVDQTTLTKFAPALGSIEAPRVMIEFDQAAVYSSVAGKTLTELLSAGDKIVGTEYSDKINTTDLAEIIDGDSGNDRLFARGGDDFVFGGRGRDRLDGGAGADVMVGGRDADTYYVDNVSDVVDETDGSGGDTVESAISFSLTTSATVKGLVENLVLSGTTATKATGNELNNSLTGNSASNTLMGLSGKDKIFGGAGGDVLNGGAGADSMTGGTDADIFVFKRASDTGIKASTRDVITDFHPAKDIIDLHKVDANGSAKGDGVFLLIDKEGAKFGSESNDKGRAGDLRWDKTTEDGHKVTIIEGDLNGDKKADFQIELTGHVNLSISDFIL